MTSEATSKHKRVRASESALTVALKVLRDQGLAVDKLLIKGGQFELHIGGIEGDGEQTTDRGLEEW